jgi:hypothetical protein
MLNGQNNSLSSAITGESLTRIVYIAIDELVNTVCVMQTSAFASWPSRDFSDRFEYIS